MIKVLIIALSLILQNNVLASDTDQVNCIRTTGFNTGVPLRNLCEITRASEVCQNVEEADRLNCSNMNSNRFRTPSALDFLTGCARGIFDSVRETLSFLWGVMRWVWNNATSSESRSQTAEIAQNISSSARLYLHREYRRAYREASMPFRTAKAVAAMAGSIAQLLMRNILEYVQNEVEEFPCLNASAKGRKICEVAGSILIPPAGALAFLKYGPRALNSARRAGRQMRQRGPRYDNYRQALNRFPALRAVDNQIEQRLSRHRSISHPRDIPFDQSNGFRPSGAKTMRERANQLSPEMSNAIRSVYNTLQDKAKLAEYYRELHVDAVNWMMRRGRATDIEMLQRGEISVHAINVVILKRLKERGDNRFTTITNGDRPISTGSIPISEEDIATGNRAFRFAVRTGPFFDRGFGDSASGGHGVITHMIQRDIVTQALERELRDPQEFWSYMGSPRGINWWADLFDSGNRSGGHQRPETITAFLGSALNARTQ